MKLQISRSLPRMRPAAFLKPAFRKPAPVRMSIEEPECRVSSQTAPIPHVSLDFENRTPWLCRYGKFAFTFSEPPTQNFYVLASRLFPWGYRRRFALEINEAGGIQKRLNKNETATLIGNIWTKRTEPNSVLRNAHGNFLHQEWDDGIVQRTYLTSKGRYLACSEHDKGWQVGFTQGAGAGADDFYFVEEGTGRMGVMRRKNDKYRPLWTHPCWHACPLAANTTASGNIFVAVGPHKSLPGSGLIFYLLDKETGDEIGNADFKMKPYRNFEILPIRVGESRFVILTPKALITAELR